MTGLWPLLLVLSLVGSAVFSGSETALVSSNRMRQRAEREEGRQLAGLAEKLYRHPSRVLALLLFGTNLFNVLASVSAMILTEKALAMQNLDLPDLGVDLLSTAWIAGLVLLFGEVIPKGIGRAYADRVTRLAAPFLLLIGWIFAPLLWLLDLPGRILLRLIPGDKAANEEKLSWERLRLHLESGREEGTVEAVEEARIRRIALMSRLTAQSLMQPLSQFELCSVDSPLGPLARRLSDKDRSRAFLYEGSPDKLQSFVTTLSLLGQEESRPLRELGRPLRRVPATRSLLDLLDELQLSRGKFAVVTDLQGRAMGVVSLQSLLSELTLIGGTRKIQE